MKAQKNIEFNALPVYDNGHINLKLKLNFRGLNVPKDGVECESFTIISIDSLLVYENKYYVQVFVDNFAHKIVDKQMMAYLDDNLSDSDEN